MVRPINIDAWHQPIAHSTPVNLRFLENDILWRVLSNKCIAFVKMKKNG